MKKMNLKKTKSKKKIKYKIVFSFVILCSTFSFIFYYYLNNSRKITNEKFINLLVNGGNSFLLYDFKLVNIINGVVNLITNIDISKPVTIFDTTIFSSNKSSSILENQITLEYKDDYSNLEQLKEISYYMEDPNKVDINQPIIYLYNTHQLENYNNDSLAIYGITPNVLMASYILKEKLNKKGISTIVEDTNLSDFLSINGWNYSSSYKASRLLLMEKKSKYNSLNYFIDIHRDSVSKKYTKTLIDGKNYAKVLFVVGLEHDNYSLNLATSTRLNNLIDKEYPTLSRGIYQKKGKGVDGIYNQDMHPNAILIEIGGVDNTIEEVYNTLEVLSDILITFIGDVNG